LFEGAGGYGAGALYRLLGRGRPRTVLRSGGGLHPGRTRRSGLATGALAWKTNCQRALIANTRSAKDNREHGIMARPTARFVMPSKALRRWFKSQAVALDQMENAHASVGGKGRGRRYTTDQINQAYAVLLASQFQGFCRDLHSESAEYLVDILEPPRLRPIVRAEFTRERKLDITPATKKVTYQPEARARVR